MATYLARSCPQCNGYLGIVLREPGRNVPVRAGNGHCLNCNYRLAWIIIEGSRLDAGPTNKTLEREAVQNASVN
jgi:hypothetical protein